MIRNATTTLSATFLKNENGPLCLVRLFSTKQQQERIAYLEQDWKQNPRWKGITRPYTARDVVRLSGSLPIEHTIAKEGSKKFWKLINEAPFVGSLGAVTGKCLKIINREVTDSNSHSKFYIFNDFEF